MPRKKTKAHLDDEIDLLSSEFLASTNNRSRGTKSKSNNQRMTSLSHERALTQSILQDLEAQSSPLRMDLEPPRAWRPNPAYAQDGGEVEMGLDEVQELQQHGDANDGNGSHSSSNNNEQVVPAARSRDCRSSSAVQFLKKHHLNILIILGVLVTITIATVRFGFPETFYNSRTTDSSRESDPGNPSNPADGDVVDINGTLQQNPTTSPTYWPTYWPTYYPTYWPTYSPTMPLNESLYNISDINGTDINGTVANTADEINSTVVENVTIASNETTINQTTAEDDELFFVGNETLSTDDLFFEEVVGNSTANATTATVGGESSSNETTSAIDVVETTTTDDNTTSSTELSATGSTVVATTVDESSSVANTTSSSEPALQLSTSTTDATTTATDTTSTTTSTTTAATSTEVASTTTSTTTESTTTEAASTTTSTTTESTTTEAASTTTAAVTTPSPHICADTTSGGKMFKISITPTTSTTSLELFRQDDNSGEYILVTSYDPLLTVGTNYINKLCVFPGKYKFVVEDSVDACYNGFFRGNVVFENCGDGEYTFEF